MQLEQAKEKKKEEFRDYSNWTSDFLNDCSEVFCLVNAEVAELWSVFLKLQSGLIHKFIHGAMICIGCLQIAVDEKWKQQHSTALVWQNK